MSITGASTTFTQPHTLTHTTVNNRWPKSRWPKGSFTVVNPRDLEPIDAKVHEQYDLFVRNVSTACIQEVVKSFEEKGDSTTTASKRKNVNVDLEKPVKRSRRTEPLSKRALSVSPPQHKVRLRVLTLIIT